MKKRSLDKFRTLPDVLRPRVPPECSYCGISTGVTGEQIMVGCVCGKLSCQDTPKAMCRKCLPKTATYILASHMVNRSFVEDVERFLREDKPNGQS